MSADNGIYIAEFLDGFRVCYAMAIDNIDYYPEGSEEWKNELAKYFGKSPAFSNKQDAYNYAINLENQYSFLEYGISSIKKKINFSLGEYILRSLK